MKRYFLVFLFLTAPYAHAVEHGPHVHGTGELQVALEKGNLAVEFHSPLDNLIGFEYTPTTEAQKAAVKSMLDKLNKPATLFKLPQAASCTTGPVKTDYQFNEPPAKPAKAGAKGKAKEEEEDHADLTASFSFTCASPDKLDSMEVLIFTAFPRTRSIKAQIIGPRGQSAATLTPERRAIKF